MFRNRRDKSRGSVKELELSLKNILVKNEVEVVARWLHDVDLARVGTENCARQKLTSPKWNRFKGIRLRWKDKIRLNNVIWRCWHMQFIRKQNTLVCQFASPLDVNMHDKPEAVVLEGKYWKRKLAAVTAEYKKWRMFYRNRIMGWSPKDGNDMITDMFDWQPHSNDSVHSMGSMMVDEDYMEFMSDTLFSTISANQPFAFPDQREITRNAGGIADFIQPTLVQLQPNLEDFMDTLEPLQDLLNAKLPSVPEEYIPDDIFRGRGVGLDIFAVQQEATVPQAQVLQSQPIVQQLPPDSPLQYTATIFAQPEADTNFQTSGPSDFQQAAGQTTYEDVVPVAKARALRLSRRSHPQHHPPQQQKQQTQAMSPPMPQQQVVLCSSPQYQAFSISDLGSSTSPSHSPPQPPPPPPPPQLPSYSHSLGVQNYKQVYHRTSPQQQAGFQSFCLPTSSVTVSHSPTPGSEPPNLRQSVAAAPVLKTPSLRSNSLPGLQDDTFIMPKYNQLKQRNRSRSGSSLVSVGGQQRQHPPPLVSHASDPTLATSIPLISTNPSSPSASTSTLQPLLAQLLTTNSVGIYNFTGPLDKGIGRTQSVVPILPAPSPVSSQPATALLITTSTPVTMGQSMAHPPSQLLLGPLDGGGGGSGGKGPDSPNDSSAVTSPAGMSLSPLSSPLNLASVSSPGPLSPSRSGPLHSTAEADQRARSRRKINTPPKDRRTCHINAEQKRRCNIKNGFDMLHSLIPQLNQNPNAKLSKAAMLQKGADYIRQLRAERSQLHDEMDSLRQQIECLNTAISNCQAMLPATGAPVSRQRASKMREMFDEYVRIRTLENWKFWILSILLEPLLASYNAAVSTASLEDLYRSTLLWVEQHCSLADLRPAVLNSLRYLCTATDILTDPSRLPDEARQAVSRHQQDQQSDGTR